LKEKKPTDIFRNAEQFWLMKTEPDVFSIDDLKKNKTTLWEGVRNYQARNHMTSMKVGDAILFYHSSCEVPGVSGLALVSKTAVPDPAQFDKKSEYFEKRATKEKPVWFCVEVKFVEKFDEVYSLEQIRHDSALSEMLVIRKGQRLSVQPVSAKDFKHICSVVE
jgi:predicted RNA-binding protein with PUA-like domain